MTWFTRFRRSMSGQTQKVPVLSQFHPLPLPAFPASLAMGPRGVRRSACAPDDASRVPCQFLDFRLSA